MGSVPNLVFQAIDIAKKYALGLLLFLAAAHGLIYVFLIPPWQHYDEPGNFEYAWLIANREGLPERGDYDQTMRREVAASMIENDFYDNLQGGPNLISINKPINIGISQTSDPPLYYQLVSLPLNRLKGTDITFQLLVGRLVSWILLIVSILSAWGIIKSLTKPNHPLRWMVPMSLALLPGFVDIMTAVNNDVGATAFFSLFLWGAVSTIRYGLTWRRFIWIAGTTLLCLFTKETVFFVLPLLGITILFGIFRENRRRWAWLIIGASSISLGLITFTRGDVTHWYRHHVYHYQTRYKSLNAPLGDHVFLFAQQENAANPQISQAISPEKVEALRGKTVTIGAWMWADSPMTVRLPILNTGENNTIQTVDIGRQPHYYAYQTQMQQDVSKAHIRLSPSISKVQNDENIYFDGVTLAVGNYPLENTPEFNDLEGQEGSWGGKYFNNLLDNPSAESGGIDIRPRIELMIQKYFPINPSWVLTSFDDWDQSAWYYKSTAINLLRTFWAKFGWGHVPLLGSKPYRPLAGVTLLGVVGAGGYLLRNRNGLPWEVIFLFGLALLFIWGAAFYRGIYSLIPSTRRIFIPGARYAYPVVIPTMIILNLGWLEIMDLLHKWTRFPKKYLFGLTILFFVGLDVLSVISIIRYYQG